MINILIVEDDYEVRLSLVNILKTDSEIHVVGETDNGFDAVELAQSLQPDLILMDIKLPGLDGLEATKRIKVSLAARGKNIKILILSTFYDDEFVSKAKENSVDGYLLKGISFDRLASAIKNTADGFVTLDRLIYDKQSRLANSSPLSKSGLDSLTKTELKILKLIVKGMKNAEIASELYFSEGTVRNYISHLLSKLECRNGRDLAVYGIKAGL